MAEYIEREAAVNAVRNVWLGVQAINKIKAADVEPVRHGRWILHKPFERNNSNECIECSDCKTWFGHDCYAKTNYCPHCGAYDVSQKA